ncbi:MAG: hypothetical protein J7K88_06880 [Candidatus Fermentibacteraceae bacterium]|nr:hypothetical protein [Candidatus Fermentibacteraceae bacterium]
MSEKFSDLLSSEDKAREVVENATKEARRIRTGIPEEVSRIEKEYKSELQKFEETGMLKVEKEIAVLREKQEKILEERKSVLETKSAELAPVALELIHAAIKGDRG